MNDIPGRSIDDPVPLWYMDDRKSVILLDLYF